MGSKRKVITIVGTRPEIIRLSRVIAILNHSTNHVLVYTGQNYDWTLSGIFFQELGVSQPNHYLEAAGKNAAITIGNIIIHIDAVLEAENPDAVLVLGDTNSCLAVLPAKRRKIPIFHMEAGNRCFDMRVPEEINRRIVDHLSDINLCYSERARQNLIAEGFPPDRVMKTGSPMKEILDYHRASIAASNVLERFALVRDSYFTVSLHREENIEDSLHLESIVGGINSIADKYAMPIVFSVHPRTRKRLDESRSSLHELVRTVPPLGFFDYVALQKDAFCTISDSGTITEESSILGFPAVTVRDTHERPEGMDEGAVIMTGFRSQRILEAVEFTRAQFAHIGPCRIPEDYNIPQISWKVVKIILSYIDYVNRTVWYQQI